MNRAFGVGWRGVGVLDAARAIARSVAVNVAPDSYLAGWRPQSSRLFLPVLADAPLGDRVAVRVGIVGQTTRATLLGNVCLARRLGRPSLPPGVELLLEAESLSAAAWLAAAARGEALSMKDRAPRFVSERPLVAIRHGAAHPVVTTNVSESGCALRWDGGAPAAGDAIALRVRDGFSNVEAPGIVAWVQAAAIAPSRVGIRIAAGGRAARAWRRVAAEAACATPCFV